MKFSQEKYEKLIELVRQRPALYNCQLRQYKDQQLHRNMWRTIAHEMGETELTGGFIFIFLEEYVSLPNQSTGNIKVFFK